MSRSSACKLIRLRGVRQNNLKNFDLDLPAGRLVVLTGVSGSGKSSLAFDTLYAEGQRRYIETFSPYARQFFERMDKPQVDSIQGIPPAIAIEQRNAVRSTRSTVGTMTEICDYMKIVWAHVSGLFCRRCGQPVRKDSPQLIWETLRHSATTNPDDSGEIMVAFDIPLSAKLSLAESLALVAKQGYQRILLDPNGGDSLPEVVRLEEAEKRIGSTARSLTILQDRVHLLPANRARLIEACEQAYHFGKSKLSVYGPGVQPHRRFSKRWHCATCDLDYREPSPALFSFNHPVGACPVCRGFGRTITIDYNLALPDRSLSLAQGAIKPWQSGQSAECQQDLTKFCARRGVPMDVPFERLAPEWQRWVIEGDPGYGLDAQHQWPAAWYGIKGYFRWLESKAYKMHVRVLLSRYRAYQTCPECNGQRFQPEALLFKCADDDGRWLTLADFYRLPVSQALVFVKALARLRSEAKGSDPLQLVLGEACSRLAYLDEVGLGYLTLDRPTRSLSGGETERVNLTTCLGSRLVNTLFVLDEPSVGLHPRDTKRLIHILQRLRDTGNTVLVVEHEPSVMRAADHIVDLGPGHGEAGGSVVFQGSYSEIVKSRSSLTGQYLRGEKKVDVTGRRPIGAAGVSAKNRTGGDCPILTLSHATRHNLKDLTIEIPLGRFVCVTGVSGSGKTTLVSEVLLPLLNAKFRSQDRASNLEEGEGRDTESTPISSHAPQLEGWEHLGRVVLVDQSLLGKTPRSNPAVYIGAFDDIREIFAQSEMARQRGLNASAFSFNSSLGQCELCRGAGFEKIEMQFLSDVYIRCPACNGRRYRQHILEVTLPWLREKRSNLRRPEGRNRPSPSESPWSIADLLEATVDQTIEFLRGYAESRAAVRAVCQLELLQEVGLGYLRLGQPINTLSGGESQRLKLVSHLAEFAAAQAREQRLTLFLFDEPTTGLHFDDVRVLLDTFQRLVDRGHSVLVIEHNLDLIRCADWVIDLGPEAGELGGRVVAEGTPEMVAGCRESHTGRALVESGLVRGKASGSN